jgi:hypothetical protein
VLGEVAIRSSSAAIRMPVTRRGSEAIGAFRASVSYTCCST